MNELTERQREILDWIVGFAREHWMPPTVREIGAEFGISPAGVFGHLKALERKGRLRRGELGARSLEIVGMSASGRGESAAIPVVGRIAAGAPLLAVENLVDSPAVDPSMLRPRGGQFIALRGKISESLAGLAGRYVSTAALAAAAALAVAAAAGCRAKTRPKAEEPPAVSRPGRSTGEHTAPGEQDAPPTRDEPEAEPEDTAPPVRPSPRAEFAAAYAGGTRLVMFGGDGYLVGRKLGDTWEYDTRTHRWTEYEQRGEKPSPRSWPAMAYAGGTKVVMFGGHGGRGKGFLGDTWEYDVETHAWARVRPAGDSPSARGGHALAYLGGTKVLLFGGFNFADPEKYKTDTWE